MNTKHGTKKGTKGGNQSVKGKSRAAGKRVATTAPATELVVEEQAPVAATEGDAPVAETLAEAAPKRKRDMTIEELQALYLEVVGRRTASNNRSYIAWKCSQARKGRIPVGPVEKRRVRPAGSQQVLPLTMLRETTRLLDAAVATSGARSRSAFIRTVLIEKLRAIGGPDADAAANALAGEAG